MSRIRILQLKRNLLIPVLAVLALIGAYYASRGIILRKAIASVDARLRGYDFSSRWDDARFSGLNQVAAEKVQFRSFDGNNNVIIDSLKLRVRLLPLFTGNIRISKLHVKSLELEFTSGDTVASAEKGNSEMPDTLNFFHRLQEKNLSGSSFDYIRRLMNYLPSQAKIKLIRARYHFSGNTTLVALHNSILVRGRFTSNLILGDNAAIMNLPVEGRLDRSNQIIEFHAAPVDTGMLPLPWVKDRFGMAAGFDSLDFKIDLGERHRNKVNITGNVNLAGLRINGDRLSSGNIFISRFGSEYSLQIGPDYIQIDSITSVILNSVSLNPFIRLSLTDSPVLDFKILKQTWDAGDFFNSLPEGMFTSLIGTKAEGDLDFLLDFSVNLELPDSLRFNIKLQGRDFKIVSFGVDDYRMLNHEFIHRVYQRGIHAASFLVGSENPEYTAFDQISPFVRASVMTSEDGSFFFHNGFNPEAFRESIAQNIKENRFARGGSTISMQLIKNVFLTKNKTIARKIEEALIVWLIENLNLVSKQRMYEVYLNIIEWGPGVYGIGQASAYYFDKKPSEINLQESVFLASIVPRPRWFKYTFEANGRPRPFFAAYFNRLKELMVRKDFITSSDTLGIMPVITLKGPATQVFDSAFFREMEPMISPMEPLAIRKIIDLRVSE